MQLLLYFLKLQILYRFQINKNIKAKYKILIDSWFSCKLGGCYEYIFTFGSAICNVVLNLKFAF